MAIQLKINGSILVGNGGLFTSTSNNRRTNTFSLTGTLVGCGLGAEIGTFSSTTATKGFTDANVTLTASGNTVTLSGVHVNGFYDYGTYVSNEGSANTEVGGGTETPITVVGIENIPPNKSIFKVIPDTATREFSFTVNTTYTLPTTVAAGSTSNQYTLSGILAGGVFQTAAAHNIIESGVPVWFDNDYVVTYTIPTADVIIDNADPNGNRDSISITGHGYTTGDKVTYQVAVVGDQAMTPLVSGTSYYVIVVNVDRIRLATTYANATAASPVYIDLTNAGTSTQMLKMIPVVKNTVYYVNTIVSTTKFTITGTTLTLIPTTVTNPYTSTGNAGKTAAGPVTLTVRHPVDPEYSGPKNSLNLYYPEVKAGSFVNIVDGDNNPTNRYQITFLGDTDWNAISSYATRDWGNGTPAVGHKFTCVGDVNTPLGSGTGIANKVLA